MKFSTVISSALLAGATAAAPLTAKRQARNEARRLALEERGANSTQRRTNRPIAAGSTDLNNTITINNTTNVDYSSNWAGAVLIGTGYTAVTAQFTVPTPSRPSGGSSSTEYCASAWVGIDGDTCSTAILQTGVDFCVQGSSVSFDAWYEWFPDYAYDFDLTISAGDVVKVTVDASSKTGGTATVENLTTNKSKSQKFSGESADLCEYNAEWIVEDFESNGELVPFANFGKVTFEDATATDGSSSVGPEGATIIDIKQNSVLTSVSVSDDSVTVTYV